MYLCMNQCIIICRAIEMQKIMRNSLETMILRRNTNTICRLCSTIEDHLFPRPPDVNRIRLIGRVSTEMIPLPDSFHTFQVTTTEKLANNKGTILENFHLIKAKRGITQPIIPHLEYNDYVLVDGIIGAMKMTDQTELAYKPIVFAKLIIPLENTQRLNDLDALIKESTNEVELVGRVITDIEYSEYLTFYIRTYKRIPPDIGPNIIYSHRQKISVDNPEIMEFVRKNVALSDYVAIRGSIAYTKRENPEGHTRRAWIAANAVHKILGSSDLKVDRTVQRKRYNLKKYLNQYCILPAASEHS